MHPSVQRLHPHRASPDKQVGVYTNFPAQLLAFYTNINIIAPPLKICFLYLCHTSMLQLKDYRIYC